MGKAFDWHLIFDFIPTLLEYLMVTLQVLVYATVIGLILGMILAVIRLFRVPVLSQLVVVFLSFIRGTPMLIQLFLVFYGLPALLLVFGVDISRMAPAYFMIITYALRDGAIFSEIFRSAIKGVDYGQTEAAMSVGMSQAQGFFRIVLPQSASIAFPNVANSVISSLKDTSLAFTIGIMDMMGRGEALIAATAHALEVYIAMSIIYYAVVLILEQLAKVFEKRANRHKAPVVALD
ncbi:amino acid ABC transporter permease [Listeria booriae]|uniref:amino acid ABC transporter permease n=1 Tax=Listeria booriae TaxID=1552123 RepID=UPI00288094A5|nr:amino acid ABC transporter permease [Listeria booriae]MDT0111331.1 amino acid ABC transporter permease [Listeria booriae]